MCRNLSSDFAWKLAHSGINIRWYSFGKEAMKMISISDLQKFVGADELCMWIISSIVFSIFYSIINIFTFKYLFDANCTKKKLIIFIAIDSVIKSICTIFVPAPYYRLLNMVFSVMLLKVIICENTAKCIVGEATIFITIICS